MKRLIVFGDTHFNLNHEWNYEAYNNFFKWFKDYDFKSKKEDIEFLHLGDVFDKASNWGDTLEIVTEFFGIVCEKFSNIYIIGGNHDLKFSDSNEKYATQYLKFFGNNNQQIHNIYKECLLTTNNGFNLIILPFRRINGKLLDDYYSTELTTEFYKTKSDLLCGHVAIKEKGSFYGGIDISKFMKQDMAFGHIHTRNGQYKEYYTGSIMPFKIDEEKTELKRCYKQIDKDNKGNTVLTDFFLPDFITYNIINFQETPIYKKNSDDKVHIYTVTNCKNLQQAKAFYPEYYIRGVEKTVNNSIVSSNKKEEIFMTPLEALDNLIKETKMTIKRKTLGLLKSILS